MTLSLSVQIILQTSERPPPTSVSVQLVPGIRVPSQNEEQNCSCSHTFTLAKEHQDKTSQLRQCTESVSSNIQPSAFVSLLVPRHIPNHPHPLTIIRYLILSPLQKVQSICCMHCKQFSKISRVFNSRAIRIPSAIASRPHAISTVSRLT